jgi:hypothetical protein
MEDSVTKTTACSTRYFKGKDGRYASGRGAFDGRRYTLITAVVQDLYSLIQVFDGSDPEFGTLS